MRNIKPGLQIIKDSEGLYLKAYKDPVGIWTIGWGSIKHPNGTPVKSGDVITAAQAEEYLMFEVNKIIPTIEKMLVRKANDNEFSALLSFAYNVGTDDDSDEKAEGLGDSTLLKKFNAGDVLGAANEFDKWINGGGKVLPGLVKRRAKEKALFLSAVQTVPVNTPPTEPPESIDITDADVKNETPQWFDKWKAIIVQIFNYLFGVKNTATVIPDNPETGAPAKATLSEGSGPRLSKERVEAILKANGVDTTKACLLGIRGYYLDTYGKKGINDRGVYDDALIWFSPTTYRTFRANCDASKIRPGQGFAEGSKGMAMLKKGVWRDYYPGMHNGSVPHLAFRQGSPVTVIRDGINGEDYPQTGMFGINIHRGGANGTSSAGCQTVQPTDWDTFKKLGDSELAKYSQKNFVYCLVEQLDLNAGKLKA